MLRVKPRAALLLNGLFAVFGLLALAVVAHFVGARSVTAALAASLPWLPVLFLIEGARIPLELWATRRLLGARRADVTLTSLGRAQLIFYAVSICTPGGRLVAEASRAALLAPAVGAARITALATASQAASLCADACAALLGLGAVIALSGFSWISLFVAGFVAISLTLSLLVVRVATSTPPEKVLLRLGRFGWFLRELGAAARTERLLRADVIAILLLSRLCQALFLGVALRAVGIDASPLDAMAALALLMVGSAAGEAIPAQLGAADAALLALAPLLRVATAPLASVGVLFHAAQLFWVAIGAIAALWGRRRRTTRSSPQDSASACAASSSTC
jgi:hypothetical protein